MSLSPCFVWLPSSSTQRTKSVSELIDCFFRYNSKQKVLLRGEKPAQFLQNRAITQRQWKQNLRRLKGYTNPVKTGLQYLEFLKDHPESTYDDIAGMFGVSKARVCQMVALCNRLPSTVTDYILNTDDPGILKHFTERKLRPLTLLSTDDDKIKMFDAMKACLMASTD